MLTKMPDYHISECGYPQWQRKATLSNVSDLYAGNAKFHAFINDNKSQKLLPLRETLNEYYYNTKLATARISMTRNSDPAQYKQHKNQSNEVLKHKGRQFNSSSNSNNNCGKCSNQPHILADRSNTYNIATINNNRSNSNLSNGITATSSSSSSATSPVMAAENDLDVF